MNAARLPAQSQAAGAVTVERLERALLTAARIVDLHGDVYLPIFERLEAELADRRARQSSLSRARALSRSGLALGDAEPGRRLVGDLR